MAGDVAMSELVELAKKILDVNPSALIYVKWTCPNCGERVCSDEPNTFHTGGYLHEGCGHLYTGDSFGMALVMGDVRGLEQFKQTMGKLQSENRDKQ